MDDMKINKLFLTFILMVLCLGCSDNKKTDKATSSKEGKQDVVVDKELNLFKKYRYFDYDRVADAKYKVLKTGDEAAYSELELFYGYNASKRFEILPYSILMVEKYKKFNYCSNVFEEILELSTDKEIGNYHNGKDDSLISYLKNIEQLSTEQKDYAISFLKLGAKNNEYRSVRFLEIMNRNGLGMKKNLIKADDLKNTLASIEKERELHLNKNKR